MRDQDDERPGVLTKEISKLSIRIDSYLYLPLEKVLSTFL